MPTRTRLLSPLLAALALVAPARAANLDGSSPEVGNAEAVRLYAEANAYVSKMAEGDYSYSYLQFYWKRAQSNVDRIRRVYAESPTAHALDRGDLKIGRFSIDYFKTRVLYNLELKRLGAADDVNCAIFLYGRNPDRNDARRDEALSNILEVLSRRQRWGEARRFPVLSAHKPILLRSIFRVAAFYGVEDVQKGINASSTPAEREAAGFNPILAEAIALQGKPRSQLYDFVEKHPGDAVRSAALKGVVEREILISRHERLRISFRNTIQSVHLVVQNTSLRDNVTAVASKLYPGNLGAAQPLLSTYFASTGTAPNPAGPVDAHLEYVQYLADSGRMDAVATYVRDNDLTGEARQACKLKVIELYAEAGQTSEAEKARMAYAPQGSPGADDASLAEFRGRMDSLELPLVAREKTFAELPISDPCVMAIAIMEWSLTPNRSQRGATPWDAVVMRYAGGFDNLPLPKSAAVGDAASTVKPY